MGERAIQRDELQLAILRGVKSVDERTGNLEFRYKGMCFVTDPTGKVGSHALSRRCPNGLSWYVLCNALILSIRHAATATGKRH